jgi:hypothetical protein
MNSLKNENLFKLIFSSFSLFYSKQLLHTINDGILYNVLISSLTHERIIKSMGRTKIILDENKISSNSLASLSNGNFIISNEETCKV